VVKGYDEKYNVDEADKFTKKDELEEEERLQMEAERSKDLINKVNEG
jgi:hypothetical protein